MVPKKSLDPIDLFRAHFDNLLNQKHPLVCLAKQIDWPFFEKEFGKFYSPDQGRPAKPIRIFVALHFLKHMYNESDESIHRKVYQNPYYQYFCGFEYFQHKAPVDSTALVHWRHRVGPQGAELLLQGTLRTAKQAKQLNKSHLNRVNVDTTVQEKAVTFPTDAKLYHRMRERLVKAAKQRKIGLRQSYCRVSKKALLRQHCSSHAKQFKRARKATREVKNYLG